MLWLHALMSWPKYGILEASCCGRGEERVEGREGEERERNGRGMGEENGVDQVRSCFKAASGRAFYWFALQACLRVEGRA